MSRRRTIIVNTGSNLGLQVVSAGLPFLTLPFMLRYWGTETYGILILAFSVQSLVQILNGAIGLTLMKYVSEIYETGDLRRLNVVINGFWVIAFVNNAFVSSVLAVVAFNGLDWLNIAPDSQHTARIVFLEIAFIGLVAGALAFIDGVMYGLQRIHQNNVFRVWEAVLTAATALGVVFFGGSLEQYVLAIGLYPIVTRWIQYTSLKKIAPYIDLNLRYFSLLELRRVFSFSMFQIINQIADLLLYSAQKLIVQKFLGSGPLTIYEVGNKPNLLFQNFVSLPLSSILPACSAAYARNDKVFLEQMLITGTRLYMISVMPATFALIYSMPYFIHLWLGDGYSESVVVAKIFLVALLISCPFKIFSHMMVGKARLVEYGLAKFFYALVGILASIFLIQHFGVLAGVLVVFGYFLVVDVPINLYVMGSEGVSIVQFFRRILPILMMLGVEYVILEFLSHVLGQPNWAYFIGINGLAIALVMLSSLFIVLRKPERALVGMAI